MGEIINFNVDMDKMCKRCGKPGAVNDGICMDCAIKNLSYDTIGDFTPQEIRLLMANAKIFNNKNERKCECGAFQSINGGPCLKCIETKLKKAQSVNLKHLPAIWPADAETILTAHELIKKYHPMAKDAAIAYVFKPKHSEANGKIKLGSCAKQSPKNKMLHGWDYIIELAWDMWALFDNLQREALLLHELCHIFNDAETWKIEPHNVEAFAKEIEVYGLWKPDLVRIAEVIKICEIPGNKQEMLPGM